MPNKSSNIKNEIAKKVSDIVVDSKNYFATINESEASQDRSKIHRVALNLIFASRADYRSYYNSKNIRTLYNDYKEITDKDILNEIEDDKYTLANIIADSMESPKDFELAMRIAQQTTEGAFNDKSLDKDYYNISEEYVPQILEFLTNKLEKTTFIDRESKSIEKDMILSNETNIGMNNIAKENEQKESQIDSSKMSFDKFCQEIANAKKYLDDENLKYDLKDYDKLAIGTALNSFMLSFFAQYRKTNRNDKEAVNNDIDILASKIAEERIQNDKDASLNSEKQIEILNKAKEQSLVILNSDTGRVDIAHRFVESYVVKDFDAISSFIKEKYNINTLNSFVKDISFNFSKELNEKLHPEIIEEIDTSKIELTKEELEQAEQNAKKQIEDQENAIKDGVNKKFDVRVADVLNDEEFAALRQFKESVMNDINPETGQKENYDIKYQNQISTRFSNAEKLRNRIGDDPAFEMIFRDLKPESKDFMEAFDLTVARLAKGDKFIAVQKFFVSSIGNNSIDPFVNDYVYCTRFMMDMMHLKYPEFKVPNNNYAEHIEKIIEKYVESPLQDLKKTSKDAYDKYQLETNEKAELASYFQGCQTNEQYQQRFGQLLDQFVSGQKFLPNEGRIEASVAGIGKAAGRITSLMNKYGPKPIEKGFDTETIKNICDKHLDGSIISDELEVRFKAKLGKHTQFDLKDDEQAAISTANLDKEQTPLLQVAMNKIKGITVDKKDPLLNDAKAVYARLYEIHNKRSGWFWLTSPIQNIKEWLAIRSCESTLKNDFKFTNEDLQAARNMKDISSDYINQAAVAANDMQRYDYLMSQSKNRDKARMNLLEKPIIDYRNQQIAEREANEQRFREKMENINNAPVEKVDEELIKQNNELFTKYRNLYHESLLIKDNKIKELLPQINNGEKLARDQYVERWTDLLNSATTYVRNNFKSIVKNKLRTDMEMSIMEKDIAEFKYKKDIEKNPDLTEQIKKLNDLSKKNVELKEKIVNEEKPTKVETGIRKNSVGVPNLDGAEREIDRENQLHNQMIDMYKGNK